MAKKKTKTTDLEAKRIELATEGLDFDVIEYRHAYVDIQVKGGQRYEYRPDGSEIKRDPTGKEVK